MMSVLPEFLLRIAKATSPSEKAAGVMCIIIRQSYAYNEIHNIMTVIILCSLRFRFNHLTT